MSFLNEVKVKISVDGAEKSEKNLSKLEKKIEKLKKSNIIQLKIDDKEITKSVNNFKNMFKELNKMKLNINTTGFSNSIKKAHKESTELNKTFNKLNKSFNPKINVKVNGLKEVANVKSSIDGVRNKTVTVNTKASEQKANTSSTHTIIPDMKPITPKIDSSGVKGFFDSMNKNVDSIGKKIGDWGSSLKKASVATGAGIVASGKSFADVEAEQNYIQAIGGYDNDGIKKINKEVAEIARTSTKNQKEILSGLTPLAQAGLSDEELYNTIAPLVKGMEVNRTDGKIISDLLLGAKSSFDIDSADFKELLDKVTKTSNGYKVGIEDLTVGLSKMGASFKTKGQSIESLFTIIGTGGNLNKSASDVSTGFTAILTDLSRKAEELEKVNINIFDSDGMTRDILHIMKDIQAFTSEMNDQQRSSFLDNIFGETAKGVIEPFLEVDWDKAEESRAGLEEAVGEVDTLLETMKQGVTNSFVEMMNAVGDFVLNIGEALGPMLIALMDWITGVVLWVTALIEGKENLVAIVLVVVTALGSLIGGLTVLLAIIGPLMSALSTLITIVGTIVGWFSVFFGWIMKLISALKLFITAFTGLGMGMIAVIIAIISVLVMAGIYWEFLGSLVNKVMYSMIGYVAGAVANISQMFFDLTSGIANMLESLPFIGEKFGKLRDSVASSTIGWLRKKESEYKGKAAEIGPDKLKEDLAKGNQKIENFKNKFKIKENKNTKADNTDFDVVNNPNDFKNSIEVPKGGASTPKTPTYQSNVKPGTGLASKEKNKKNAKTPKVTTPKVTTPKVITPKNNKDLEKANDELKEMEKFAEKIEKRFESLFDSFRKGIGLFSEVRHETRSIGNVLFNARKRAEQYQEWSTIRESLLSNKNLDSSTRMQLAELTVKDLPELRALYRMNDKQLKEFSAYNQFVEEASLVEATNNINFGDIIIEYKGTAFDGKARQEIVNVFEEQLKKLQQRGRI